MSGLWHLKQTSVGIIGLGSVAIKIHLPILSSLPGVRITAVAELDSKRGERIAKRWRIPRSYVNYKDMLESSNLDAVFVCLPNSLHYEATYNVLEHDLHVFCEKSMGLSSAKAQELVGIARRKQLILAVGYFKRFEKNYERCADHVRNLRLGKITQAHGVFLSPGPHSSWIPRSNWFLGESNGGVVFDSGAHLVDLILYVLSDDISEIFARSTNVLDGLSVPDNFAAVYVTKKGVIGTLNAGWQIATYSEGIQIHGTGGSVLVGPIEFEEMYGDFSALDAALDKLKFAKDNVKWGVKKMLSRNWPDVAYRLEDIAFVEAVRGRKQPYVTGEDAVRVLEVLEAIQQSLRTGECVRIR